MFWQAGDINEKLQDRSTARRRVDLTDAVEQQKLSVYLSRLKIEPAGV